MPAEARITGHAVEATLIGYHGIVVEVSTGHDGRVSRVFVRRIGWALTIDGAQRRTAEWIAERTKRIAYIRERLRRKPYRPRPTRKGNDA